MGIFISILLATVALGFTVVAAIAETAFTYLPHNEAEEAVEAHPGTLGARVLQRTLDGDSEAYTHPLRLTRLIAAAAAVLATMTFLLNLVEVHALAIVLTLVIVALVGYPILHVLARTLGRNRPVASIRVLARPVHYLSVLLSPATGLLDHLSTRIAPAREAEAPAGVFEEEELREFLERASDAETIEDDEAQMVQSVFEMDDLRIRSLMVPRTDMLTVGRDVPLREALSLFLRSGYSRMPVIGDSSDEILGILYLKDSMRAYILHSEAPEDTPMPTLVEIMRPARFEPETKRALDLLRDMQRESTHVAIVVDEYGGTAGLITLEDLIEELVGDISDEYDHERPEYTLNDDGTFRLSARLGIDELGEIFGIDLEDEDVDTVGGLLAKHLGMVPIVGSEIEIDGIHIRAIGSSGRRHQVDMLQAWYEPPRDEQQNAEGSPESLESNSSGSSSPEPHSLTSEVADILTVDTEPPAVAEPHAHPDLPGDIAEAEPATDKHGNR